MIPSRPYLIRALHEWIVDSGCTPHLLVAGEHPLLVVPDSARKDGQVVLNVSPGAVRDLVMDNELISFVARFGGVSRGVSVPVAAVKAIYARENGRGMVFPEEDGLEPASASGQSDSDDGSDDDPGRPRLRVVK
ncbi:MAG: ClpXP protease specificity-enhancing factor [Wenzhouxiangella sp.]|nr:ClpXP protease specificity-enhancing factor [Wenzhouxiangella sp.]MCH8476686.1 ClpXP protease specificity-enhancing factor [Wenzhouxiangella sp.]TVR96014.1 MAG: ClpXP protease specificity-enhancing factor [Wenzhouxiangellaceae bacterium]